MTAIRASHAGDPRVSPDLSSHVERHSGAGRLTSHVTAPQAGISTVLTTMRRASGLVLDWPTRSHRRALRNAMLASTVLLERRIESDEVESFLRERDAATLVVREDAVLADAGEQASPAHEA